jgi:hypothetical protein
MSFSAARKQLISNVLGSGEVSPKFSRPHRSTRLIVRGAVGTALLAISLHAGDASALGFTFTFTGIGSPIDPGTVTGIVDGLVDNLNDQKTGLTWTITSSTNTPSGGWNAFTQYYGGDGFDVSGGQVIGVDIAYTNSISQNLFLGNQNNITTSLFNGSASIYVYNPVNSSTSTLQFTPISSPAAPAPSPLPLFGAAAAFGWSRQLRRRIKTPA